MRSPWLQLCTWQWSYDETPDAKGIAASLLYFDDSHSMATFILSSARGSAMYVWPGLTNCFPGGVFWVALLYQLVSLVQKVEPSASTTLFGILECHCFGEELCNRPGVLLTIPRRGSSEVIL